MEGIPNQAAISDDIPGKRGTHAGTVLHEEIARRENGVDSARHGQGEDDPPEQVARHCAKSTD